jgi:hypothetical protein
MEPLSENELKDLLPEWQAPGAPPSLTAKVLARRTLCRWILTGTIRVPVPVGIAMLLALAIFFYLRKVEPAVVVQPAKSVSLADFQPVKQLEPRIIGRANDSN